jgi:hypothetical protein
VFQSNYVHAQLGTCGATWKQRLAIPEYACFNKIGGTLPFAVCAAGAAVGYKPVYFGEACQQHDACYSSIGERKSKCDKNFRDLLILTCDITLEGEFRGRSRRNCHNLSKEFYFQVRERGCKAYKAAQAAGGVSNADCN